MPGQWYVTNGKKIKGPFSRDRIETLVRDGKLKPHMQVSTDKRSWQSIEASGLGREPEEIEPIEVDEPLEPESVDDDEPIEVDEDDLLDSAAVEAIADDAADYDDDLIDSGDIPAIEHDVDSGEFEPVDEDEDDDEILDSGAFEPIDDDDDDDEILDSGAFEPIDDDEDDDVLDSGAFEPIDDDDEIEDEDEDDDDDDDDDVLDSGAFEPIDDDEIEDEDEPGGPQAIYLYRKLTDGEPVEGEVEAGSPEEALDEVLEAIGEYPDQIEFKPTFRGWPSPPEVPPLAEPGPLGGPRRKLALAWARLERLAGGLTAFQARLLASVVDPWSAAAALGMYVVLSCLVLLGATQTAPLTGGLIEIAGALLVGLLTAAVPIAYYVSELERDRLADGLLALSEAPAPAPTEADDEASEAPEETETPAAPATRALAVVLPRLGRPLTPWMVPAAALGLVLAGGLLLDGVARAGWAGSAFKITGKPDLIAWSVWVLIQLVEAVDVADLLASLGVSPAIKEVQSASWIGGGLTFGIRAVFVAILLPGLELAIRRRRRVAAAIDALGQPGLDGPARATLDRMRSWALRPLLRALVDPARDGQREAVAGELQRLGDASVVGPLVDVLLDGNARSVHREVVMILGAIADPKAFPTLSLGLRNADYQPVRREIVVALGAIGNPRAVPGLVAALRDFEYRPIHAELAAAIEQIGDARALDGLLGALADRHCGAHGEAAAALASIALAARPSKIAEIEDLESRTTELLEDSDDPDIVAAVHALLGRLEDDEPATADALQPDTELDEDA